MAKKLALLIGVSEYGEGFEPLSAPPKDVAAFQQVLQNPELGGFDQVTPLHNPNPTEMRMAIERLFASSGRDDLLLLFFSGHGITDDSFRLYLTTRLSSKDSFRSTSVDARFIQDLSDGTYAKRQVIILDCCYSGAFAEGWQRKGDVKVEIERELGKEGRVVLTSSSATQVSFQQEDAELSLYTQYLVEGIETGAADDDRDGVVKVRELHSYAKRKVQEAKPKMKPDIIVVDDEGYEIELSQVKRDVALLFRQLVEQYTDHDRGEIRNRRCQEILDKRAREWGLSSKKTASILASVLEPSRRRLKSLERYRQEFEKEAQLQYPLEDETLSELREWRQTVLGLEDHDVTSIQQVIIAKYQSQSASSSISQLHFEEVTSLDLKSFAFEVVEVDVQGTIVRKERQQAYYFAEDLGNGITLEMVQIPGGIFKVGSPENEVGRYDDEMSQHDVKIQPFFIGKFSITQAQYKGVTGENPATQFERDGFVAANKPVVGVSWRDASVFCQSISNHTGKAYRLPTEVEWEYACRSGTLNPFCFGNTISTNLANYDGRYPYNLGSAGKYRKTTVPVDHFRFANNFGLFNLHGNVWEWCSDQWLTSSCIDLEDKNENKSDNSSIMRVIRGGSWRNEANLCRSAFRYYCGANKRLNDIGFRIVCNFSD